MNIWVSVHLFSSLWNGMLKNEILWDPRKPYCKNIVADNFRLSLLSKPQKQRTCLFDEWKEGGWPEKGWMSSGLDSSKSFTFPDSTIFYNFFAIHMGIQCNSLDSQVTESFPVDHHFQLPSDFHMQSQIVPHVRPCSERLYSLTMIFYPKICLT